VVDRLGEDVIREIVETRWAGAKLKDIAEQHGVSLSTVKRLIQNKPKTARLTTGHT
jgi:uncharacterized protein YjcR